MERDNITYDAFLARLSRLSPAQASWHCEINAELHGKTVREVCADYLKRYGVPLGN